MNRLMSKQRMVSVGWWLGICLWVSMGLGGLAVTLAAAAADWVQVGSAGFSAGAARYLSLALDSANTPYVAYRDVAYSDRVSV